MDAHAPEPVVDVVFVGADIGVYAMARAFHERTGRRSTVVAGKALAAVRHSSILDMVHLVDPFDESELVTTLTGIAKQNTHPTILLTNSDHFAGIIARHEDALRALFFVPMPSKETIDLVADKTSFMEICTGLGIRVPTGITVDLSVAEWEEPSLEGFTFPLVGQARSLRRIRGREVSWQEEDLHARDARGGGRAVAHPRSAGYPGSFLLQEYIPGGDDAIRSVTAYVDATGAVSMECAAQVLLEECAPHKLGIPAAMVTMVDKRPVRGGRALPVGG